MKIQKVSGDLRIEIRELLVYIFSSQSALFGRDWPGGQVVRVTASHKVDTTYIYTNGMLAYKQLV